MKSIFLLAAAAILAGGSLSTDYTKSRSLRVELSSSMELETKSMRVERNGEPMDTGMGGMSSSSKRTITYVDKTLEHKDGEPVKVRREFEDLANESTMTFGDRQMDSALKPRLAGVALELTLAKGEVDAKVVEGDADSEALEGHSLQLILDAFLPEGDAESWELDNAAIKRGLALDVQKALFAPPEAPSGGDGGDRGRGRSRGGMMGGGTSGVLSMAELEGKATLTGDTEEHGGVECKVIKIEIKGSGDLPEPEGFGGGRGRAFDPAGPGAAVGSSYEIELEGRLLFDAKNKLPVHLSLKGELEIQSSSERTFNETTIKSESVQGGPLEFEISVSVVDG